MLCSDAKEIDPSDIDMKERLGAGQFGVSVQPASWWILLFCILYLLIVGIINFVQILLLYH